MASNNAFTLSGATPQTPTFSPKPSSKLTVSAKTPVQAALDTLQSHVNTTAAKGISLAPGTTGPGGGFIPAKTITPDTQYAPVGLSTQDQTPKPTLPGLMGGTPLVNNKIQPATTQPPAKTIPLAPTPPPAQTVGTPGIIPQTTGYNAQTGGTFAGNGATLTPDVVPPAQPVAPTGTFPGLIGGITTSANQSQNIGNKAAEIAERYGKQIADVGQQGARAGAGYLTTGTSPVAEGNAAIQAQTTAAQQSALAAGEEAALAGTGQQLTGANQQTTGLTGAAGLAQPKLAGFDQQSFNPSTGQFSGGGSVDAAVASVAQKVQNGTMSYDQASSELSAYGVQGTNALRAALGSNFNVNQSNSNATIQGEQNAQVQTYKSALQQGQNLQSQFSDLVTTFGLNPNDLNAANQGLQAIARNTSDPRYQLLQNYVNDIANTYAQVLTPTGGSQTDTTRSIAASMLNPTSSGQSILQVMQGLDNAAQAKIAGVPTTSSNNSQGQFSGAAWK